MVSTFGNLSNAGRNAAHASCRPPSLIRRIAYARCTQPEARPGATLTRSSASCSAASQLRPAAQISQRTSNTSG